MSEGNKRISQSSNYFMSGTFLSRISGLTRDVTMAYTFGVTPAIAAFLVAFRFSSLLRRLFGEGALVNGFIPYFESLRAEDVKKGATFFRDLVWTVGLVLTALVILIEISLSFFRQDSEIIQLTMILLPGLIAICFYALFSALLQCENRFFLTAIAPAFFNLVWIIAMIFLQGTSIIALSYAVLSAFFIQWLVVFFPCWRVIEKNLTLIEWFSFNLFSKDIVKMLGTLSLAVVGVGALQFNSAFDALFARVASLEGPAYLTYAIRLYQLPLALFAISIASALLPTLSREKEFSKYLSFALKRSFTFLMPCTLGIFALGAPAISLIYAHGKFDADAVQYTAMCLSAYGIGLIPSAFVIILAQGFYALKDYKTPTLSALFSVGLNILLNGIMIFGFKWGAVSVALATSVSSFFNFLWLYLSLDKNISFKGYQKIFFSSCLAYGVTNAVAYNFDVSLIFLALLFSIMMFLSGGWRLDFTSWKEKMSGV